MVSVVEDSELAKGIRVLESQARSGVDDDSAEAQRKRSVEDALRREMEDQKRAYLERKAQEEGRQVELSQVGVPLPPAPLIYDTPSAAGGAVVVGPQGVVSVVGGGAAVLLGRTAEVEARGPVTGPITRPRFGDERQSAFDQEEFVDRDPDGD
jgi:hypothetical protein